MRSLRHLSRGIEKFERALLNDGTSKIQRSGARSVFGGSEEKFIRGQNQEMIIPSPYGKVTYPDSNIPEYVWRNVNEFSKLIALVSLPPWYVGWNFFNGEKVDGSFDCR